MAGPTVTLTFAGDASKLDKAMKDVGSSADQMSKKVSDTSKSFHDVGRSTDEYVDKADKAEQRSMGFRDTITGLQDTMKGLSDSSLSTGDRLLTLGAGVGDLASGFANLLIPALGKVGAAFAATAAGQWLLTAATTAWSAVTTAATTVMAAFNAVIAANPIVAIIVLIGLLVGAFILLWNKSAAFRDFFIDLWNGIKKVVGATVDWIKGAWNGLVSFFSGLVSRIGGVFSSIGNAIKNAFKGAVNFVIGMINGLISAINMLIRGINAVNPFGDIPSIPKVPKLHTGGVVPGIPGQEVPIMAQAGERVVPKGQSGSTVSLVFSGDVDSAFVTYVKQLQRTGQLQALVT